MTLLSRLNKHSYMYKYIKLSDLNFNEKKNISAL